MLVTGGISTVSGTYSSSYGAVQKVDNSGLGAEASTSGNSSAATRDRSTQRGGTGTSSNTGTSTGTSASASGASSLTMQELQEVSKLKKRDQEVRNHEQAHMAAGGQYVRGAASYSYEVGPDGRRYAVGGEVSIDMSPVSGDPAATIRKMAAVRRAALAPADPSGQDLRVASSADAQASKARSELMNKVLAAMETSGTASGKTTGNNIDTIA